MNKSNNRRGFTLAELSIVLAVLVIVSAMVVSFTTMVGGSQELSSARLDAIGNVQVAEAIIESFIEGNEIADFTGEVSSLETANAENKKTLTFNLEEGEDVGGTLSITDGETDTTITLERVTEITFDYYGNGTDGIYYCTIKYQVGNHDYDYTFCVNPYVGETVGGN